MLRIVGELGLTLVGIYIVAWKAGEAAHGWEAVFHIFEKVNDLLFVQICQRAESFKFACLGLALLLVFVVVA